MSNLLSCGECGKDTDYLLSGRCLGCIAPPFPNGKPGCQVCHKGWIKCENGTIECTCSWWTCPQGGICHCTGVYDAAAVVEPERDKQ